jgi:hypothetical protein
MRISLHRHGGLAAVPGLELHVVVDTATLPKAEAAELETAVRRAGIDRQPPAAHESGAGGGAADRRQYDLVIEDGSETRSVLLHDPIPGQGLRDLVKLLISRSGT